MEALKNVLPFILILGGLGVWSLDKKYSNKLKGTLSGILFVIAIGCILYWNGGSLFSGKKDGSFVITKADIPKELNGSTLLFTISGSSVINDKLTIELLISYFNSKNYTDVSVNEVADKKYKAVSATANGEKIRVDVYSPGTKEGFDAISKNNADLCMASAQGDASTRQTANESVIGMDGMAVVTNSNNPLRGLSKQTLSKIFLGEITSWKDVPNSSASGDIVIYKMGPKTGIYKMFKEMVLSGKDIHCKDSFEKSKEMVAGVAKENNAIGFVSYTYLNSDVKAVPISDNNGLATIVPNTLSISSEKYPLCRRLYMYKPKQGENRKELNPFIDYVKSVDGQNIVQKTGFVSLNIQLDNEPTNINTTTLSKYPATYRKMVQNYTKISSEFRFETGQNELDSRAYDDVERLILLLSKEYAGKSIYLVGHTDNTGTDDINNKLSLERARNFGEMISAKGATVDGSIGLGSLKPVRGNETVQQKNQNRRVEVWVKQ